MGYWKILRQYHLAQVLYYVTLSCSACSAHHPEGSVVNILDSDLSGLLVIGENADTAYQLVYGSFYLFFVHD